MLRRSPGFTATAVLTLGLGIGATTALFSVASEVLFRPLPVADPQELVFFRWTAPPKASPPVSIAGISIDPRTGTASSSAFSHAVFAALQSGTGLDDVFGFAPATAASTAPGLNDGARGQLVTGTYFRALGLRPRLGRLLSPEDARDAAPAVVVISHRYWLRQFAAAEDAIGRGIRFDQFSAPIVGVAPAGFTGLGQVGDAPDFFLPFTAANASSAGNKFAARMNETWVWPMRIFGRLSPGQTITDVETRLQAPFQQGAALAWTAGRKPVPAPPVLPRLLVDPGGQGLTEIRAGLRETFALLALVVGAILLIVCVNLVNLLLARAEARHGEMAVRLAIGAKRTRLVRQLLTETLLLSGIGAALGLALAWLGKDVLLVWLTRVNANFVVEPAIDATSLVFTGAVAVLVAVAVGLAPALQATRTWLTPSSQLARLRSMRGKAWIRRTLLVAQVGLSLVLLVIAGLLVRTLVNLQTADVGFDRHNVLVFRAAPTAPPPPVRDARERGLTATYDRLREALEHQPGVVSVAYAQYALLGGELPMPFLTVPGRPRQPGEDRTVYSQAVSPQFFATAGMPLTAGRTFLDSDRSRRVAVINETLARRFFPDDDAIGRFITESKDAEAPDLPPESLMEIVGIVRDAKYMTLRDEALPTMFVPFFQNPGVGTFYVRTAAAPASFVEMIRRVARDVTPAIAVAAVQTQQELAAVTYARESHLASLATFFAMLALALTAIGLYGLISYSVTGRTREIGLRMALGARRGDVIRAILRETAWLVTAGIALGLVAAPPASRVLTNLLFGLAPTDAVTFTVVVAGLAVVALLAAALPARRAARVDPVIALRTE
jgi:predicted permease